MQNLTKRRGEGFDLLLWLAEKDLAGDFRGAAVVEPPSRGLDENVLAEIREWRWRFWISVSCNSATFARDVSRLSSNCELFPLQRLGMFGQTAEIEIAGVLRCF